MIRFVVSTLVLIASSSAFAASTCNSNLKLSCSAIYQSFEGWTETLEQSAQFEDENWDEPSLASCTSTIYFKKGDSSVRVYVSQDGGSDIFNYNARAATVTTKNGITSAEYSNELSGFASQQVGMNMGSLTLAAPVAIGNSFGKTVYVGCRIK